jgi:peptide deformylase
LEFLISTNLFIWQDFGQHQEEFAQVDTSGLYRQVSEGNRHKAVMINPKLTEKNDEKRYGKGMQGVP